MKLQRVISKVLLVINLVFGVINVSQGLVTVNIAQAIIGVIGLGTACILAKQLSWL